MHVSASATFIYRFQLPGDSQLAQDQDSSAKGFRVDGNSSKPCVQSIATSERDNRTNMNQHNNDAHSPESGNIDPN